MTSELKKFDSSLDDEKVLTEHVEVSHAVTRDDLERGRTKRTANTQLDDAAKLLEEAGGHVEYTHAENKRVLRLIDFYVCLPMCLVYFIQQVGYLSNTVTAESYSNISQLDKASVSYAAVFDLQVEANLVGTQYSWLSSVV